MEKFSLNILGCGSATPTARHLPACQVINFRDTLMMIDCGEGAQLSVRKMGLKFSRISHIFISHLHGDHCLGLPGLLSTMALHGVGGTVKVYMHREGIEVFSKLMDFICTERPYTLEFVEIPPKGGVLLETHALTVEAFPLYHRIPTSGFIFREKPKARHIKGDMVKFFNVPVRDIPAIKEGADLVLEDGRVIENSRLTTPPDPSASYAYCSDTIFNARVAEAVRGVDVIYHESTYKQSEAQLAKERFHSTAAQAAEIARMAGARLLILGHYSKRYESGEEMLDEAVPIFPDTIAANEGMVINLNEYAG
ncbi:MAG: ribonuclease Z [Bacteroidales bacterium]|nr:ribonuclease Z [Bacteroidales bacterium]MBD5191474.1 ribonuclease Z [Bacteroidales bacterium]